MADKENPIIGTATLEIPVTAEDVDDIMTTALEGGITYWCDRVDITRHPDPEKFKVVEDKDDYDFATWEYAHEVISRGGELTLYDSEAEEKYTLDLAKFMAGLHLFLTGKDHRKEYSEKAITDGRLDCGYIDADGADLIVQYALFGEIVYS